jgi:hypothetical protein
MQRFLTLVAVAVVAGAMYVAAAPGSRQAAGPTAKQFGALKKQVAGLEKEVSQVKTLATAEGVVIVDCMNEAVPVDQFGDGTSQTEGYVYSYPDTSLGLTTALDVADANDTSPWYFLSGTSDCAATINSSGLRHIAALAGVARPSRSNHQRTVTPHRP